MGFCRKLETKFKRLSFIDRRLRKEMPLPYTREGIVYRLLSPDDSIDKLTSLINQAYGVFNESGLEYKGVSQDRQETIKRIKHSYTIVALAGDNLIGTISYKPPWECRGSTWYNRPEVAKFNQLAVDRDMQKNGIGGRLLEIVELIAARQGAKELALDTAEEAQSLVDYYKKRYYRFIAFHKWKFTNYRSVILSKNLEETNS